MTERISCMFDSNIFDRVVEEPEFSKDLAEFVTVYVTHIQRDEINDTPCPEKWEKLNGVFADIVHKSVPTESADWDVSKWDEARWTKNTKFFESIEKRLNECEGKKKSPKKGKVNTKDALIAETAIINGFKLITDDKCLREVASEFDAECMHWENLQKLCRANQQI